VIGPDAPMTPEVLVPRIGDYLIERGALTQENLDRALAHSRELAQQGRPRLVGQVLLDLGMVDRETLDQVITEQILQLQNALQQTNQQLEQRVQERTRELQNALNKLAELNQLKSNFVANVSHELRTPLTHLRGYLDLMDDGTLGTLSEDQRLALEVMLRSESRLEELIDELIQFSLASSEQLILDLQMVDFGKLVSMVIPKMATKAQNNGLALEMELADQLPYVRVDEDKFTWVVMELLDNSIKFTPRGGRVKIAVRQDSGDLCCAVTDTGIGIPQDRLAEIFTPFHQLDSSVTRRYGGVGLGLALVKKIMEAHGAIIQVQSQEGKGTQFEFRLPIYST
jgi:signal transduction histidine kinase